MVDISSESLSNNFNLSFACAPGAIELAALAKHKIMSTNEKFVGVIFLGIVIRGGTSHYELVTNETLLPQISHSYSLFYALPTRQAQ